MKKANVKPAPKPALGDLVACEKYVHEAGKVSAKPNYTINAIWCRFLSRSFCQRPNKKSRLGGAV